METVSMESVNVCSPHLCKCTGCIHCLLPSAQARGSKTRTSAGRSQNHAYTMRYYLQHSSTTPFKCAACSTTGVVATQRTMLAMSHLVMTHD